VALMVSLGGGGNLRQFGSNNKKYINKLEYVISLSQNG
jgi:hypothetical protein